jgi:hypothetical protein
VTDAELELLLAALPAVIQEAIKLWDAAKAGTVDLTTALAQATALQTTIAADNAAADAAENAKFGA